MIDMANDDRVRALTYREPPQRPADGSSVHESSSGPLIRPSTLNTDGISDSAAIGVDSINLDEAGLHYASFLRSVRMLRGAAAATVSNAMWVFVIFPVGMMIGWIVGAPGASFQS